MTMGARTRVSFGKIAVPLWTVGGRRNQVFLLLFSRFSGWLSNALATNHAEAPERDMWGLMWVGRSLIFARARNLLILLVAGGGFEPPTFGL